jgi:hypothetical protein
MMKSNYKVNTPSWYIYNGVYNEWKSKGMYVHRYRWMRNPKTHANRKRLAAYPEFTRGKQRKLPSNWDDMNLSFNHSNCWKRFTKKRKQYS